MAQSGECQSAKEARTYKLVPRNDPPGEAWMVRAPLYGQRSYGAMLFHELVGWEELERIKRRPATLEASWRLYVLERADLRGMGKPKSLSR